MAKPNRKKTINEVKTEIIGQSKQIVSSNSSDKSDNKINSIKRELKDIHIATSSIDKDINKLSSPLRNMLSPETTALSEMATRRNPINSQSMFNIVGKTKKSQDIDRVISADLETRMRTITQLMPTGMYGRVLEAKYNNYLEENLPILKQSLSIYTDDVCNGSYRGDETDIVERFRFYKNGIQEKDQTMITKFNDILNPKSYSAIAKDVKTFNEIDYHTEYNSRKNGYSMIRVLSNKKIAMDLYIKYVLKNKKAKYDSSKKKLERKDVMRPITTQNKNTSGIFDKVGSESYNPYIDRYMVLDDKTRKIKDQLYDVAFEDTVYTLDGAEITKAEARYIQSANESFADFVANIIHKDYTNIYSTTRDMGECKLGKGSYFTVESYAYPQDLLEKIYKEHIMHKYIPNTLSSLESTIGDDIDFDDISYDEIMAGDYSKLKYKSIGTEDNSIATLGTLDTRIRDANSETGVSKKVEEVIANDNISYSRLNKMFETISGESVEYLDNTRLIPIMIADKCAGAFYIEYTHEDVEHYMGLRQIVTSNVAATDTSVTGLNGEEQEETLGRMLFTDTIRPMIEKNMDTKFLKNNQDILYTIYKLLRENEVSQTAELNNGQSLSVGFNLSRIIFIPEEEIIFKRNGYTGLGVSKFTEALVPANAAILANESYLTYLLNDSKGMTIVTLPQGLSEVAGEEGVNPLIDQWHNIQMTRLKLRDLTMNNFPLGHKMLFYTKLAEAQDISTQSIEYPAPAVDDTRIQQWIQEATSIVGYNSAQFNSIDGSVEFARNLYEMNEMKLLEILESRKHKIKPSSELATKLLRLRDPSYAEYTVEWVAPPINRSNGTKRTEIIKETQELYESYLAIADSVYEENENYALAKEEFKKLILAKVGSDDKILADFETILSSALQNKNVALASTLEEDDSEPTADEDNEEDNTDNTENEEDNTDNEDNANEDNPFA